MVANIKVTELDTPLFYDELLGRLEEADRALMLCDRQDEQRLRDERNDYERIVDQASDYLKNIDQLNAACLAILDSPALKDWPALRTALTCALRKLDA